MNRLLFVPLLLFTEIIFAQSYADEALLFTRNTISGSARVIGSGGAYGSVGADLGSVAINPAGLGLYRSTDFSFTPAVLINNNQARFLGASTDTKLSRIYFNQAGVSFTKLFTKAKKQNEFSFSSAKLTALTFAINYQRQNMFDRQINFDGFNQANSAISYIAAEANFLGQGLVTSDFPVGILANSVYLIGYDTVTGNFYSNVYAPIGQSGKITTRGANDHIDIALGGNVNDKFYFGAGLGVTILTHSYTADFEEHGSQDTGTFFNNYKVSSSLRNTGLGVNSKFGIIYRPASWMRLGVAYHIPSFYSVTENYSVTMYANYDTSNLAISATGNPFKYKLRTPMKGVVSASFFLKENGFFSVDYEFLNYGSSKYNFGKDYEADANEVNAGIKKYYTFGHVVRAGVEAAYKTLRIRGGYSFSSTPYKKDFVTKEFPEVRHAATFGLGYRGQRFYVDFAYLFGIEKQRVYPYADFEVSDTSTSHRIFLTFGWKMNKAASKTTRKKDKEMRF